VHRRAILFAALAVLAACRAYAGAEAVRMSATAGLGGIAKAGRWAPVRVLLDARDLDITGEIVVEWGAARVKRDVAVAAPSRRSYELYIQSGDVRDEMGVTLISSAGERHRVQVPIRLASIDEPVTVCIDDEVGGRAAGCSVTLASDALPRSWRGYDVADLVVWSGRPGRDLADDQKRALDLWQAMRAADVDPTALTPLSALPTRAWPPRPLVRDVVLYLVAIGIVITSLRYRRARSSWPYSVVVAVAAIGSVAVVASGRHAAMAVQYVGVVEQFGRTTDGVATIRAIGESPSAGLVALHTTGVDAALENSPSSGRALEESVDADGNASLRGHLGLGASFAFTVEAAGRIGPFSVGTTSGTLRVTNIGDRPLYGCEFPPGFDRDQREILPGKWVETAHRVEGDDPIVTCRSAAPPVTLADANHPVVMDGETVAVVHLKSQAPE